jgi:choice-of-anchor C domain-containing protein
MEAQVDPTDRPSAGAVWSHPSRRRGNRLRFALGVGLAGALVASGTFVAAPAEATSGLSDGFETPVVTPRTFRTFSSGQSLGAWTVTGGTVDLNGAGFWQSAEGVQSLDLNGHIPGAVARTIPTNLLTKYRVSYALAGNTDAGPAVKTGKVLVNGEVEQNFSFDITGKSRTDMGYVTKQFTFLSSGTSATLQFASTTPGAYGPVVDKVQVESCLLILCL